MSRPVNRSRARESNWSNPQRSYHPCIASKACPDSLFSLRTPDCHSATGADDSNQTNQRLTRNYGRGNIKLRLHANYWSTAPPVLSYAKVSQVCRRITAALNEYFNGKSIRYRHGIAERPAPLFSFNLILSASRRLGNSTSLSFLKLAVCTLRSRIINRSRTNVNGKSSRLKGRAIVCALALMSSHSRLPLIFGLVIEKIHHTLLRPFAYPLAMAMPSCVSYHRSINFSVTCISRIR